MNCLCCGKPLKEPVPASGWHPACIRRFFGTRTMPKIELTEETLTLLAEKAVQKMHTVPGVQKKLSLHLSRKSAPRLTPVDYPTGYSLKPQVSEFRSMPEAEHLVMQMSAASALSVVPHALIRLEDSSPTSHAGLTVYGKMTHPCRCLPWRISVSWICGSHRTNIGGLMSAAQK